jgi:capsular exopolysaccharide synthesis family protein
MAFTDVFVKTEFESITKMETLYPVVDQLDLTSKWESPSRQSALGRLKGNLDTQSSVRSDFVVIEFFDPDPKLAADVANAVADSYMKRRVDVESKQKEDALAMVQKQITEQEKHRDLARMRMQQAKQEAGIVGDWFSGSSSRTPGSEIRTPEESMQMSREQALLEADLQVQELQAQIDQLSQLNSDQLVAQASGLGFQNSNVLAMQAKLQDLMVEREGLVQGGLGAKHPNILALDAQIATSKEQILGTAGAHLDGLQSQLKAAIAKRNTLKDFNEDSKNDILGQQNAYNVYKIAKDDVEQIEELLLKLKERFFEEKASMELVKSPATIYASAEPETRPSKPNVALNLALGGIMGLKFGVGLAFILEYMDTTVKSLDDVEKHLGVPVLAVVPKDVGVLHQTSGFNPDAEAYRILRTNIEFNRREPNANCLTVVSGGAGEGKSTTLANLADVCAQGGYNVLLIDGDLRRPRMHTLFGVSNATGLTNFLTSQVTMEDVVIRTQVENLYFLPSGMLPADSAGILNSQRMSELISEAKSRFDLVLIDSPPILGVSDASVLVNEADMTMIVVQHRKLPRHMLLRVRQAVEQVGGNVLGVVLNNVDLRSDSQYQYYTSYYTYYTPTNTAAPAGSKKRKRKGDDAGAAPAPAAPAPVGDVF